MRDACTDQCEICTNAHARWNGFPPCGRLRAGARPPILARSPNDVDAVKSRCRRVHRDGRYRETVESVPMGVAAGGRVAASN